MQLTLSRHRPIKNSVIRIELSPSPKHTRFYRMEDWQELWHDFAEEFDKQVIRNRDGTIRSCPTHLAGSKYTVWLHQESASGIPHLHAAVCRMDEEGRINNDHQIHLRAQRAAEQVARKRGWTTAVEGRSTHIQQMNRDCMEILREMPSWSWDAYREALVRRGYSVAERRDSKEELRGYSLRKGEAKYKASELGVARNLTVSPPAPGKNSTTARRLPHRQTPLKTASRNRLKDRPPPRITPAIVPAWYPTRLPVEARNSAFIFRSRYSTSSMRNSTTGRLPTAAS